MRQKKRICLMAALVLLLCLWGCGSAKGTTGSQAEEESASGNESAEESSDELVAMASNRSGTSTKKKTAKKGGYKAPSFAGSEFHENKAQGNGNAALDLSAVDQGYVAVSAESGKRLKFQVKKDDATYNYDIASDGTPSVFPLQGGDGDYLFKVMENITGTKYAEMYSDTCTVKLKDEFQPFLRPSDYVDYTKKSACVKKAAELAESAEDELEVIGNIFEYICDNVKYDTKKAETVKSGYLPDPDETMRTGKGICFDYAALAAAMLRSQGIPAKMIFGNVSPDDLYHAWNMFYTKKTGWVTVKYKVKGGDWSRLDATFAANGTDSKFIGDGNNYSDVYFY